MVINLPVNLGWATSAMTPKPNVFRHVSDNVYFHLAFATLLCQLLIDRKWFLNMFLTVMRM